MACELTPEEIAAIKAKIADAEEKYHQLMLGNSAHVFVDQNGERVEYTAIRRSDLLAYLNYLRGLLPAGDCKAIVYPRPLGFVFR